MDSMSAKSIGVDGIQVTGSDSTNADKAVNTISDAIKQVSKPVSYTHLDVYKRQYLVYGPRVDRMLGYTNLESEKGVSFFQRFLRQTGILDELKALGIEEGDTVRVGEYLEFDYYD